MRNQATESPEEEVHNLGPPRTVAVVDIGTSSIRMAVAEIHADGQVRSLETLSQAVNLGRDTFTIGAIRKDTIEECVRVLKAYKTVLTEYQVTDSANVRVIATSAVREAANALAFRDRVYIATGLDVEPIDEAEVNRITFIGIEPFLSSGELKDANTIVMEVGGGSTELLLIQSSEVVFSHAYRLGSIRLREALGAYQAPRHKLRAIMRNQIDRTVSQIEQSVRRDGRFELVALGGDVRFAARQLLDAWNPSKLSRLSLESLEQLTDQIMKRTVDELVHEYHMTFPEAETLAPALLTYVEIARMLKLSHIWVTSVNLRDGLLMEMAAREIWTESFRNQIVRSAINVGRRFQFDENHARHVADLSLELFRQLQKEHNLEQRYELILYVAALLHEIGHFIGSRSHHKHSMYLIQHSELFGFSKRDVLLAALIARYHRRASPKPTHPLYSQLDRQGRVAVAKLAGILRIAKTLDESHSQRIREFSSVKQQSKLVIEVADVTDLSIEQIALRQGKSLFEETFGLAVTLRAGHTKSE